MFGVQCHFGSVTNTLLLIAVFVCGTSRALGCPSAFCASKAFCFGRDGETSMGFVFLTGCEILSSGGAEHSLHLAWEVERGVVSSCSILCLLAQAE